MKREDVKIVLPVGALGSSRFDSELDSILRDIAQAAEVDSNSWPDKYGTNFENNVFMMHRFCWCEEDNCPWCVGGAPNFLYKPTDFSVQWYKYIGRSTRTEGTQPNLAEMRQHCTDSLKTGERED